MGSAAFILAHTATEAGLNEAALDASVPDAVLKKHTKGDIIERANGILRGSGKSKLEDKVEPRQSMKVLIAIRDGLVHFRPEWSDAKGKHSNLSKLLISAGVPLNPNLPNPIDAFPLACMYADAADWAISTAESFIREIRTHLDGVHRDL